MKRFHVHVRVDDLARSVDFYSALLGCDPARLEADYAKWMLEDPRLNFAISARGAVPGIDHLGFEVDSALAFADAARRSLAADAEARAQPDATCCYARSDKHWATDPSGIAWETFRSLAPVPGYGEDERPLPAAAARASCCAPAGSCGP